MYNNSKINFIFSYIVQMTNSWRFEYFWFLRFYNTIYSFRFHSFLFVIDFLSSAAAFILVLKTMWSPSEGTNIHFSSKVTLFPFNFDPSLWFDDYKICHMPILYKLLKAIENSPFLVFSRILYGFCQSSKSQFYHHLKAPKSEIGSKW